MTLNPWLEEKVQEYRRMNNAMVLRANYAIAVKKGARLSWSQHLILRALASAPGAVGFLLPEIDKKSFFSDVKKLGVLPRKTFSMGEADEKRFYMEAKEI